MPRSPVLAALFVLLAGTAEAQAPSRVDPALRLSRWAAVARPDTAGRRPALPGARAGATLPLGTPVDIGGVPYVRVLVRVGPGGEAALRQLGARIGVRAGDVVTARIPVAALSSLAALPAVRFLEAAVRLVPDVAVPRAAARTAPASADGPAAERPVAPGRAPAAVAQPNDTAVIDIGVDGLRRRSGDRFYGLTGRGVVIGIVDTGLDLSHEDFRDADGRTRVLYAWDQDAVDGRPPGAVGDQVLDCGRECIAAEIDAGECPLTDRVGHGTHVAGIAAGDGSATGNGLPSYRYVGVAPEADLIVVRAGDDGFTSDRLLEGVAYIFARAAELGRPAVVNLSVATQAGPHDGSTLLERGLDALAGPGRLLVAGAGNQGVNGNESPAFVRAPLHATDTLAVGAAAAHALIVPPYAPRPGPVNDGALLELWYDGADSLAVAVVSPRGDSLVAATGDSVLVQTPGGTIGILNAVDGPQATNGDHVALIAIADEEAAAPPDSGRWTIRVRRVRGGGSGGYHLWLVGGAFDNPTELAKLEGGTTNTHLVGSPATADRVIAVAGYVTKHEWRTAGGATEGFPFREPVGDIASFSSPGPRRDGVLKPEIAAPAKVVVSARAAEGATFAGLPWLVEEDGVHAALLGTSMAAPFVSGVAALLLQLDPTLTPERARELLAASARQDAFTATPHTGEPSGTPNAQWGYGKLDAAGATRRLRPGGGLPAGQVVNLSENPVRSGRLIINTIERPRSLAVYAITGERVRTFGQGEIGDRLTVWNLETDGGRPVANGAYVLALDVAGKRVLRKIFVLRP
ncbi:MAG TPA: S8 family serine peptidase [Longimicrobiales bacterium]